MKTEDLAKMIIVTAEMIGHELSRNAAVAMTRELDAYDPKLTVDALRRCSRECRGRLTLADVINRIDDGHPGADQAWAMCPRDEHVTVVWTDEMSQAFGLVSKLMESDETAARMAFRETYTALVAKARNARRMAQWQISMGHDASGRRPALEAAVNAGKLPADVLRLYLPPVAAAPNKRLPASTDLVPLAGLVKSLPIMQQKTPEKAPPKLELVTDAAPDARRQS